MNVLLRNPTRLPTAPKAEPIISELRAWIAGGLRLEAPRGSVRHHLETAEAEGAVADIADDGFRMWGAKKDRDCQSFVIQHNWGAAFKGATEFDVGAFRLPYPHAWFEFRVSGKPVLIDASENDDFGPLFLPFVKTDAGWVIPCAASTVDEDGIHPVWEDNRYDPLMRLLVEQIRAVCISLEAEVATTEVVEAPERLAKARVKLGRAPPKPYHIVTLNRPSHGGSHSSGETAESGKVRLHFRRGHWRHLVERKTWVRWTLVGNPDLGFVEKHYRLRG